ncbi:glycosyltransferase [Demequina sp. SYSU T00192]|uniref:Glycosyltransferase n=1 Tax=Demequina litoralis TaxID=3051660 RepID=A0ABT8G8F2_9MICO|nr:glycosyltransferase [Demequina sp. SYSU T00192]MDN4475425.1 glycosyltransferase [Demequina sp. SYSU T00192]
MTIETALLAYPMHGQHKLSNEGYRTRDGHLIEWFGNRLDGRGTVTVVSRPEPAVLLPWRRYPARTVAPNTKPVTIVSRRIPSLRDRQKWWVDSLNAYHRGNPVIDTPVVTWNPFLSLSSAWQAIVRSRQPVAFDLLDDWTIHHAFEGVRGDVDRAYRVLFEHASSVTANAEGTVELAQRYGRDDVALLTNGCDPDRFSALSAATGAMTVGYVGKIGRRLDLALIVRAACELPQVRFLFAGPVLDREYAGPMKACANIEMLGDVHYDDVPSLLSTLDIGWVPHRVGTGEVGGDVIKTYEYRAAGLPVLTTPVTGASSRGLDQVTVLGATDHVAWLAALEATGPRVPRAISTLPDDVRWSEKADFILGKLGLEPPVQRSRHQQPD